MTGQVSLCVKKEEVSIAEQKTIQSYGQHVLLWAWQRFAAFMRVRQVAAEHIARVAVSKRWAV